MKTSGSRSHVIAVETITGEAFEVSVTPFDTIKNLKTRVCELRNVPEEQQNYFLDGTQLHDRDACQQGRSTVFHLVLEVEMLLHLCREGRGDWDKVESWLDFRDDEEIRVAATAVGPDRGTALHHMSYHNAPPRVVSRLLCVCPHLCNARDRFRSSPLHWAACNGSSVELLRVLIDANEKTTVARNRNGNTPLLEALKFGKYLNDIDAVESLARNGAINVDDKEGMSPAHWANVKGARKNIVGMLVQDDLGKSESKRSLVAVDGGGCYPPDTYSFIARYEPVESPQSFMFGTLVFFVQVMFLLLLILNVTIRKYSSLEVNDGKHDFIPGDVEPIVKLAQYLAVLALLIFVDDSIMDVITGIDMLPNVMKAEKEDKVFCLYLSSFLRIVQGGLALGVSFILIFTAPDVKDLVLNFTAINFISGLDNVAFDLATNGHYGMRLKDDALQIKDEELPACVVGRDLTLFCKNFILGSILTLMIAVGGIYTYRQTNSVYLTKRLRVQFDAQNELREYSGCYTSSAVVPKSANGYRILYEGFDNPSVNFGYCKKRHKWYLFNNTKNVNNDACSAWDRNEVLAYSSESRHFDIQETFSNPWFSVGGAPFSAQFLQRSDYWSDEDCNEHFGDGKCYEPFNKIDYAYDGGDCCGSTCEHTECGNLVLNSAFGTSLDVKGNGFPTCKNPEMVDIIIQIESVVNDGVGKQRGSLPIMMVDCDERTHLMIQLQEEMGNQTEIVKVRDGANCSIVVTYEFSEVDDFVIPALVEYSIAHKIEGHKILQVMNGKNEEKSKYYFQLLPKCYLDKLEPYVDHDTLYCENIPQRLAIDWLLRDASGNSDCAHEHFVERYALAAINFRGSVVDSSSKRNYNDDYDDYDTNNVDDINYGYDGKIFYEHCPNDNKEYVKDNLWISTAKQCSLRPIVCKGGNVEKLDLREQSIRGVIPTELGLLPNLTNLQFGKNDNMTGGTIPSVIGELHFLEILEFDYIKLTGTIPSELGNLDHLWWLELDNNKLTGTIPSELGKIPGLNLLLENNELTGSLPSELNTESLILYYNFLNGTIPSELGKCIEMDELDLDYNDFTGTVPFELGELHSLEKLYLCCNDLTGTIPSELGKMNSLKGLYLQRNHLTGAIPSDLGKMSSLKELYLYENQLSGTILSEWTDSSQLQELDLEDNALTGTVPSQFGELHTLKELKLGGNRLTGSIPSQLGNIGKNLKKLFFHENNLTGTIPSELVRLSSLEKLQLYNNSFTGELESFCDAMKNLKIVVEMDCSCCTLED